MKIYTILCLYWICSLKHILALKKLKGTKCKTLLLTYVNTLGKKRQTHLSISMYILISLVLFWITRYSNFTSFVSCALKCTILLPYIRSCFRLLFLLCIKNIYLGFFNFSKFYYLFEKLHCDYCWFVTIIANFTWKV